MALIVRDRETDIDRVETVSLVGMDWDELGWIGIVFGMRAG